MPRSVDTKDAVGDLHKTMKALLLAQLGGMKQREQIVILDRSGFGQKEIAILIGTSAKAVSVRLAEIRKKARRSTT